tara:strand:+ start:1711 stop:2142 length:432 start_codon:yes stop_codon:yes gene_type:complete
MNSTYKYTLLHNETLESVKGLKVYVYFNLHKKVFSVKALEGANKGRVIAHAECVKLRDCTFKVSEAGRQRVLREQKKYVHAGVVGTLYKLDHFKPFTEEGLFSCGFQKAYYNPYSVDSFVCGSEKLSDARLVALYDKKIIFKK